MYESFELKISKDGSIVIPSKVRSLYTCFKDDTVVFETCDIPKCILIRKNIF